MHFTGTIWRPPYEAESVLLQVTAGCMHNKCRFCSLYDLAFSLSPLDEIEEDLCEAARHRSAATRVFMTGANPFGLPYRRLESVIDRIHAHLPLVQSIGGFSRITDVARKSDDELALLAKMGVDDLTIGVETGFDEALAFMDKGYTAADVLRQGRRLDAVGIGYSFFYLAGVAGAKKGKANAHASATVFNALHPRRIGILSLTVFPEARLARDIEEGRFEPASERELLEEIETLVSGLTIPTFVSTNTISNAIRFEGLLPRDKEEMTAYVHRRIAVIDERDERALHSFRLGIRHL